MRAWELYEQGNDDPRILDDRRAGGTRKPIVSLRDINQLKQIRAERQTEHERRQKLWSLMYGQGDADRDELERRESQLDTRELELRLRELEAKIDRAITKAEVNTEQRDHLHQMAMRELNREKNHRSATSS